MSQFRITSSRERILTRIPDYEVTASPFSGEVTVKIHGEVVAQSRNTLLVKESRHANYWRFRVGDTIEENVVWSYEDPDIEVTELRGLLSFYTDRAELTLAL
jgi:uncharacterized protein (DUF427 family)